MQEQVSIPIWCDSNLRIFQLIADQWYRFNSYMVRFKLYDGVALLSYQSVSIPIWCDSNNWWVVVVLPSTVFQFLYGAIQTNPPAFYTVRPRLFQFLYGAIQTDLPPAQYARYEVFQFLYGAIQTSWFPLRMRTIIVSIPIWCDSNLLRVSVLLPGLRFQFLYGAIQTIR